MKHNQLNKTGAAKTGKGILDLINAGQKTRSANDNSHVPGKVSELHAIWESLLGHSNFSDASDFFHIGGNSLKAVQLVSRISSQFVIKVELSDIFSHPVFAEQNELILQKKPGGFKASPIHAKARPSRIPLSFSQERLWFIDQMEGSVQYHIPAAIKLNGKLDKEALEKSIQTIINRHEVLRTVFSNADGQAFQKITPLYSWQLTETDQFQENPGGLQEYIEQSISAPFDLRKDHML
ncbi:MAG: condensation domain-containing protein, partial [Ginsengibacter sp.]